MIRRVVAFAVLVVGLTVVAAGCGGANKGVEKPENPVPRPAEPAKEI